VNQPETAELAADTYNSLFGMFHLTRCCGELVRTGQMRITIS
jgi:hypothetical protein